MSTVTAKTIRAFLIEHFSESLKSKGFDPAAIPDNFDLLQNAVTDSFGVLEMISAIEAKFGLELDFEALDPSHITTIAPLCNYVEQEIRRKKEPK